MVRGALQRCHCAGVAAAAAVDVAAEGRAAEAVRAAREGVTGMRTARYDPDDSWTSVQYAALDCQRRAARSAFVQLHLDGHGKQRTQ